MSEQLRSLVLQACDNLGLEVNAEDIHLERPQDASHGDWACNIALVLSKRVGQNPRAIGLEIAHRIEQLVIAQKEKFEYIQNVEVAGPGFINFKLADDYFVQNLHKIDANYGRSNSIPKKIMIEYGQPNTHKMLHIGHLFSYIAGDSLAKILEFAYQGNILAKANYQGDVGPHVAKCIYGWRKMGAPRPDVLREKVEVLQQAYQSGAQAYENDDDAKAEIQELNKQIYRQDEAIMADWRETRQWSLDYYLELEKRLGVEQKFHYLESQIWQKGSEIVKTNVGKIFEESEGAIVFKGEDYGLHTRVFLTKAGTPTYEAKDMGLIVKKSEDWPFDQAIITTAVEQSEYFKVVIAAIEALMPDLKGRIKHLGFGMISLSSGKMSSRSGNILSAPELLDVVKARVEEIIAGRDSIEPAEKDEIAEKIAQAAVKFAFLKGNLLQDMRFDLEQSVSFDGDSGPYLLYTYARIQSVLNAENLDQGGVNGGYSVNPSPQELSLLKQLERFPETVRFAADKLAPHYISTYLNELAQEFNSFYKNFPINSAESTDLKAFRRDLAQKTGQILQTGLRLLGIQTVEKM